MWKPIRRIQKKIRSRRSFYRIDMINRMKEQESLSRSVIYPVNPAPYVRRRPTLL